MFIGGSKGGGVRDARHKGIQSLSISCSFWENLAKLYVQAPPPPPPEGSLPRLEEILDPPLMSHTFLRNFTEFFL